MPLWHYKTTPCSPEQPEQPNKKSDARDVGCWGLRDHCTCVHDREYILVGMSDATLLESIDAERLASTPDREASGEIMPASNVETRASAPDRKDSGELVQATALPGSVQISSVECREKLDSKLEEARSMPTEKPPEFLFLRSPHGQQELAGVYSMVLNERPNGQPCWKHHNLDWWLYSNLKGRWCIGGQDVFDDRFARSSGFIFQTKKHRGEMPHDSRGSWQRWDKSDSKFHHDKLIDFTALTTDQITNQHTLQWF